MHVPWNRGGLRTYLMLLGLLAGYTTPAWIAFGIPFVLVGVGTHLWAKGCLHQNREVTTTGPYRFVRHPFYVSNAFLDLGVAIMSGWWPLLVALPFWWLAVYIPTMRKEEATLIGLFGQAYLAYRDRVPLFIPYRRPLPEQLKGFSWRNPNLAHTEIPRALRFLSYPLLFVISYRLHSQGLGPLFSPTLFDVLTLAACVALYVAGEECKRHFKRQRLILPPWIVEDPARFAILAGVIAIGACVRSFEVEVGWAVWPPGFALVGLSAVVRKTRSEQPALAEAFLAVGLAILFELHWFAILLVPLYLAIILDTWHRDELRARTSPGLPHPVSRASVRVYYCSLVVGVVLCLIKELWR